VDKAATTNALAYQFFAPVKSFIVKPQKEKAATTTSNVYHLQLIVFKTKKIEEKTFTFNQVIELLLSLWL